MAKQTRRANRNKVVRVAIVGGGCAGLAAAWQLSRTPGYQVSVFEKSFRLGGKGASGRDAQGRILEHGLHVWLGFYENAFRMVRECYDEVGKKQWGPGRPNIEDRLAHASFSDAFVPEPHIGVSGDPSAGPTVWSGYLPPEKGLPGDPLSAETNPFTVASYLLRCIHLLKTLTLSVIGPPAEDVPGGPRPETRSGLDEVVDLSSAFDPTMSPDVLIQLVAHRLRDGTLTLAAAVLQAATIAEKVLQDLNHSPQVVGSALNFMRALAGQARKQLVDFVTIDEKLRWKTEIIDIVMTIAVGLYRDRVLFEKRGLDGINDLDYREWLLKHGATKSAVKSRFITGIYDLVFAYEGGDRSKPKLAAGVALRGALRMFFTYRGSMFWRMRSGMGDAVFAPLYKAMSSVDKEARDRGLHPVKFHFMHELAGITFEMPSKERRFVTRLTFKTTGPMKAIVDPGARALDHFGCWPASDGHLLPGVRSRVHGKTVLNVDEHFEAVILALGRDEFVELLPGKGAKASGRPAFFPPQWLALVRPGQTVATKAAQVWLDRDLQALGWYRGPGIISALGLSFDTWADMTHTLSTERAWRQAKGLASPALDGARAVAYFCGVLADGSKAHDRRLRDVSRDLNTLLSKGIRDLWPMAFSGEDGVRVARGATRFEVGRHVQANTTSSDGYALSLPGSIRDRLSPLDRAVLNLSVAGDWTACGLDVGCVEAAVMSGMLAAHAITGDQPSLASIVGYDHP